MEHSIHTKSCSSRSVHHGTLCVTNMNLEEQSRQAAVAPSQKMLLTAACLQFICVLDSKNYKLEIRDSFSVLLLDQVELK